MKQFIEFQEHEMFLLVYENQKKVKNVAKKVEISFFKFMKCFYL